MKWKDSIWFFDLDDTLIDTAGASYLASPAIRDALMSSVGKEAAVRVYAEYDEIYTLALQGYRVKSDADWSLIKGGRAAYEDFLKSIEVDQQLVKEQCGAIKKWSREAFIKLASLRAGVSLTPQNLHNAADAYWTVLAREVNIFSHAVQFLKYVREEQNRPVCILTGSDGRLIMRPDGQFDYVPEESRRLKMKRVLIVKERGIEFDVISIGDPIDKPYAEYFVNGLRVMEDYLGSKIDLVSCVVVGDSFAADLKTPLELDFGLSFLYKVGQKDPAEECERCISLGNLMDISGFMD